MKTTSKLNRRSFIGGQVALATLVSFGGVAQAKPSLSLQAKSSRDIWQNGVAQDFAPYLGQSFTAQLEDGTLIHMKLADIQAGDSGPDRPKTLARSESVSLVFESDMADELAERGHQSAWVFYSDLGEANLFIGAVPNSEGRFTIETVLN
ncbi:MAG: hypothetical protein WBF53_06075 [Litorimonas sp.]